MERFMFLLIMLLSSVSGDAATAMASHVKDHYYPYSVNSATCEGSRSLQVSNDHHPHISQMELVVPPSDRQYGFVNATRRKLGQFRACAPCQCCSNQNRQACFLTACCYRINCSIRNLPYGLCLFVPVDCHCFGCS